MDFSRLSGNERLALYGAVAAVIGGAFGGIFGGALMWLAVLAAVAAIVVILLPQLSPTTTLPGSRGSILVVLGAIAGVIAVLTLLVSLQFLGSLFAFAPINGILLVVGVAGALVLAWAAWQEFQAEGGKLQLGTAAPRGGPGTDGRGMTAAPPAEPGAPAAPSDERREGSPPAG